MKIPSFIELIETYSEISEIERLKSGVPCKETAKNTILGVRKIVGENLEQPVTWLTRKRIDNYIISALGHLSNITVWGYISQLQAITARWTRRYYKDRGLKIHLFDIPTHKKRLSRYQRPDPVLLDEVKKWYSSLLLREDKRDRIAAMLMLEFAVRNGDIERLTWSNFIVKNKESDTDGSFRDKMYLSYTPHKTALSSGRTVCWPVHPTIRAELEAYRGPLVSKYNRKNAMSYPVITQPKKIFRRLNKELRKLGFSGSKALYELRKICIDHVYQKYGAEMATSISGDDIKTVLRYYADPSAVNFENVRIIDLIGS